MTTLYHSDYTPRTEGSLHQWSNEKDNCGMGAIALLNNEKSYQVLDLALQSVCNMTHRGAVDADGKTGDGSGILCQIPRPLFAKALTEMGSKVDVARLAVGVFFFPSQDTAGQKQIQKSAESIVAKRGMTVVGWREVPVNQDELGKIAQKTRPEIQHFLIDRPEAWDEETYERQLFLCRRELELQFKDVQGFYMPSFSGRLISYKGLAMPAALRAFYGDLQDSDFQIGISLYHQRFSTNTFPAWPLGQPFRMMCHNLSLIHISEPTRPY